MDKFWVIMALLPRLVGTSGTVDEDAKWVTCESVCFRLFCFCGVGPTLFFGNHTFDAIAFGACRIEIRTWSFGFVFVSLMDFVLSKLLWSQFKIYSVVWLGWWWYIIRNSSSFLSRWDHEITYVPCKSTSHVVGIGKLSREACTLSKKCVDC